MTGAQLKNTFTAIGEVDAAIAPSTLALYFTTNHRQLVYFVISTTHRMVLFLGKYALHHIYSDEDWCSTLRQVFEKDELLRLKYHKTVFAADTFYELVPDEFLYLVERTNVHVETYAPMRLSIISKRNTLLEETLLSFFPRMEYRHINYSLLQRLPACLDDTTHKLFVQVSDAYFDVLFFDEHKVVRFMNRYTYRADTDFIYFLLLCAEELKFDRENSELVLIGEVDIQSRIYDLCYRYFRHITFIQKPESIHFSKAFDMFPKHLHFSLYNFAL
ncbi:MAG: DUF3822 family protein [Chitinophagales bacterium]|nr:DUF3822 family protein [Chitinophagales bacterium]MDW8419746.1 DUF3822 family protein [Chitinophagales bacterium]